jgi:hypothetical protein
MALTETFVIRIYRRGRPGQKSLVGTVESVNTQRIRKFSDFEELCAILERSRFPSVTRGRKRRTTGFQE